VRTQVPVDPCRVPKAPTLSERIGGIRKLPGPAATTAATAADMKCVCCITLYLLVHTTRRGTLARQCCASFRGCLSAESDSEGHPAHPACVFAPRKRHYKIQYSTVSAWRACELRDEYTYMYEIRCQDERRVMHVSS
jgi:hypothetical protein